MAHPGWQHIRHTGRGSHCLQWLGVFFLAGRLQYAMISSWLKNVSIESKMISKESIFTYLRKTQETIPQIPAVGADVFRSFVRHCIIKLRISKANGLVVSTPQGAHWCTSFFELSGHSPPCDAATLPCLLAPSPGRGSPFIIVSLHLHIQPESHPLLGPPDRMMYQDEN